MKIVHIITRLIVGGAQEVALLLCEGLHDRGEQVTLLTGPPLGPEGSLMERARGYGYRVEVIDELVRAVRPATDWRAYRRLAGRLAELRPDVVHTHSSKAGIIGRWAAHRARVPVVIHHIHGLSFTASTSRAANAFYLMAERRTAPVTTRIICVAEAMKGQSLAHRVGRPEQYITIHNGIRSGPFLHPPVSRDRVRRELRLMDRNIAVGTIARLFHLKGHEDLLEIASRLCLKHPEMRFVWIGDGLLRPQYERWIAELALENRFILTGLVPPGRIPELVNAMDVIIHPSRREGLALALAQGALAGKPVVTYDLPGAEEAVEHGQTGLVVPAFDRQRLGDALQQLLEDPTLRCRMGQAGRELALQRFDADAMVERVRRLYQDELRGGGETDKR